METERASAAKTAWAAWRICALLCRASARSGLA
jgi:hypothetical protein